MYTPHPRTRAQRAFKSIHDYNTDSYELVVPGNKALVVYQVAVVFLRFFFQVLVVPGNKARVVYQVAVVFSVLLFFKKILVVPGDNALLMYEVLFFFLTSA